MGYYLKNHEYYRYEKVNAIVKEEFERDERRLEITITSFEDEKKMLFSFHDSEITVVFNRIQERIEFWSKINSNCIFNKDVENELTDLQLKMNEKLSALEITINKEIEEVIFKMGPTNKWNYGETYMHFYHHMFQYFDSLNQQYFRSAIAI